LWLAVLLFLLGLILIGVEIFVIPGFGVTGISGILMLLVSLALVTLDKKPETSQEWVNFGGTLSLLGFSLVGAIIVAMLLARSLPSLPYAHRLVLQPPGEAAAVMEEAGLADTAADRLSPAMLALLGAIGVAVTPLRPAGMARFGDDFVDVVAEGSYVEAGLRVQVIEIEGNRVTVKEV
jgi:membrane-bound ClpP family serine protease